VANFFAGRPAQIGAVLAIATAPLHLFLTKLQSEQFAALLLACMGAIYAGFALQKGNLSQIAAEAGGAIACFAGALAALWVSAWVVPFAYIAHGIWDYAHHEGSKLALKSWKFTVIPRWYAPWCAAYDVVAAVSLAVIWSLRN
jgi:hypothetical protein